MAGGVIMYYEKELIFDKLKEECGVFGVYNKLDENLGAMTYFGLYALQHRGQESSGIAVVRDGEIHYHKAMGLVNEVFDDEILERLRGNIAIGHVRYSTTGESYVTNAQPLVVKYRAGSVALAHNGNLINTEEIRSKLEEQGVVFQTSIDSEVVANLIARYHTNTIEESIEKTTKEIKGSYALVIMTKDKLIGVRDANGIRPLVLGQLKDGGYVLSSESCGLDAVGARLIRDILPGEMVVIDDNGIVSKQLDSGRKALCMFEYIYFARPDSVMEGRNIYQARCNAGKLLAMEHPVQADVIISVPDSGTAAAIGYAQQSGIPFGEGLIKNRYIGRTFIQPTQKMREVGVKIKLNSLRSALDGKRVVMVDDSIVRGTTSKRLVEALREAGAREVHVRVSSSPVQFPCFYGIDTPTRQELIGANHSQEEIGKIIGADSIGYLSIDGMIRAAQLTQETFCLACFNGEYPILARSSLRCSS